MLDVQSFCFKLIMSHNVEGAITKHLELNLVTRSWMKINSSPILSEKFNEYNKLAETTMVQMLGFVQDERTFNNFSFMKNKL
jgi:hypothetical protein